MRVFLFLILAIAMTWAANDTGIVRFLNLTESISCPGDNLTINALASDGTAPSGIELRLVLYEPYYGLRGIAHTDANGSASIPLSKTGNYRIYPTTADYNHPDYVEFNYTELCPPPPLKEMNLSVFADCTDEILVINATSQGAPLGDVFVSTDSWSSMTGQIGSAVIPFQGDDYVFISAQKQSFSPLSGWFGTSCGLPG